MNSVCPFLPKAVFRLVSRVVLGLVTFAVAVGLAWADSRRLVLNPYEEVDWKNVHQVKTALHVHTGESDGSDSPEQMIDTYRRHGYGALAITDHNRCTWPWERWGRSPSTVGMIAIPGNELSRHHHAVSLLVPFETSSSRLEESLLQVAERGGVVILAHPGRYWKPAGEGGVPPEVLQNYINLFTSYDVLVGMEVINFENRYPHDRLLWDALLVRLMPNRPVWGYANDDAHSRSSAGRNWVMLLLPEPSLQAVGQALRKGHHYFASVTTHDRIRRDPAQTPVIHEIRHDVENGVIHIVATCGGSPLPEENCSWIANGTIVHRGLSFPYRTAEGFENYVRAELRGPGGTTFTQPFGFAR